MILIKKNVVYVSRNLNNAELWTDQIELDDVILRDAGDFMNVRFAGNGRVHLPSQGPRRPSRRNSDKAPQIRNSQNLPILVRLRHRGELIPATLMGDCVVFEKKVRRPASGQSVVFYGGEDNLVCLGGGFVK